MAKPGPGPRNLITDVAGLRVGQAEDPRVRSGVTVILAEGRAVCAVDVRGGAPGTRETDALAPENLVDEVDAVVLSGGSVYGLAAADGVTAVLGAAAQGYRLSPASTAPVSPIVPAAILYDLANGGDKAWGEAPPYRALGMAAVRAAGADFRLGTAGAGDAFCAGVLLGLHDGWDVPRCLLTGVCMAAACLSHPTCTAGVGPLDTVLKLAKKFKFRPPLEAAY